MLLFVAASIVCGAALGVIFRVYVLFLATAAIVCGGGAYVVASGSFWGIVPTLASIVSVQIGYAIGAMITDAMHRPGPSESQPPMRT